jgi:hypothetical protein
VNVGRQGLVDLPPTKEKEVNLSLFCTSKLVDIQLCNEVSATIVVKDRGNIFLKKQPKMGLDL